MAESGKVVQLFQKPEDFIPSRARQLKLGKCYISNYWEDGNIANVIVSRCHINGNFTIGIYLIDFTCLGIKDASLRFNISSEELESFIVLIEGKEIEYSKVHNIIYGAKYFAERCGFKPYHQWEIAKFILEEDDDRIPLTGIDFGENGVPAYYVTPDDDPAMIKNILATLDKHIGHGNYFFYQDAQLNNSPKQV